jgi:protein-L-isoaspartate(D-aspartate) O-methyltransferase
MSVAAADQANQDMVDRMIAEGALWSAALIAAFRATPRHRFLDRIFQYQRKHDRWREIITRDPGPEELHLVYSDRALITHLSPRGRQGPELPISSSSQPSLMAQMLEDLKLHDGLSVLEVGAGTGYNAALLAHVVGAELVTSIDVDRNVLAEAWDHLRAFPERRVELRHADGRVGYADAAPYDRIMVTAATPDLEPAWLAQLADRGLILAPLALAPGLAYVVRGTVTAGVFQGRLTRAAYFMPLRAEGEAGASEMGSLPPEGEGRTMRAPWAGWFDRRRARISWLGFSQALAFYGWVRGLTIHFRSLPNGQPVFGVSRAGSDLPPNARGLCWLGIHDWQVIGDAGRALGWELWRAFLDAGGPWPTEFRLLAGPGDAVRLSGRPEEYLRQGPCCRQVWSAIQTRDRPSVM